MFSLTRVFSPFCRSPLSQPAKLTDGRSLFIVTPYSVRFAIQSNRGPGLARWNQLNCGPSFARWIQSAKGAGSKNVTMIKAKNIFSEGLIITGVKSGNR